GDSALFREYLDRYHYQRYRVPFGAHLRYLVRSERYPEHVLACLLWTSPAWKLAERDRWIGWRAEQRARNLQFIVNHSRFLILPWVRVKGLASKILSHCARPIRPPGMGSRPLPGRLPTRSLRSRTGYHREGCRSRGYLRRRGAGRRAPEMSPGSSGCAMLGWLVIRLPNGQRLAA